MERLVSRLKELISDRRVVERIMSDPELRKKFLFVVTVYGLEDVLVDQEILRRS